MISILRHWYSWATHFVLVMAILLVGADGFAHAFAPGLFELSEQPGGVVTVRWKEPAVRATGTSMRPVIPASCKGRGRPTVEREGTGLAADWTLDCPGGLVGTTLSVEGLGESQASAVLRLTLSDGRVVQRLLTGDEPAFEVPALQGSFDVMWQYGVLGVEHILSGWDHLAFVLGLLLLVRGRALIWTVSSFTLGHSITLALAVLGFVQIPQAAVEALIALSIFILAVEVARRWRGLRAGLADRPWLMALAFGLLHGLGFAGALHEVGLPSHEIPAALFAFNMGIEAGQLLFVAAVLLLAQLTRFVPARVQPVLRWVPAYAIGSLGIYWFLERLESAAQALGIVAL